MMIAPSYLNKTGKELFNSIANTLEDQNPATAELLGMFCQSAQDYRQCREELHANKSLVVVTKYTTRPHPAFDMAKKAGDTMSRLARQMGLVIEKPEAKRDVSSELEEFLGADV